MSVRLRKPRGVTTTQIEKLLVDALRAGLTAAVAEWHAKYMPEHFTVAGGKKYGYQPRKGDNEPPRIPRRDGKPGTRANRRYSWQKRRKLRHNRPLVWSGESEAAAKAGVHLSTRRMQGNIVRGFAAMRLPTYFYQYRKDLKQPNKAAELTATVAEERESLAKLVHDRAVAHLTKTS